MNKLLTEADLADLRNLNERRSAGPWAIRPSVNEHDETVDCIIAKGRGNLTVADDIDAEDCDAAFIVAAANKMGALLAHIEALTASLSRVEGERERDDTDWRGPLLDALGRTLRPQETVGMAEIVTWVTELREDYMRRHKDACDRYEALLPFAQCEPLDFHTNYEGALTPQSYGVKTKRILRAHDFQEAARLSRADDAGNVEGKS